jgi:hypothetical protein
VKVIFSLEPNKTSAFKTLDIPEEELEGLDSIEVQELINQKYLEWVSGYIEFDWEVVETEESE